MTPAELAFYEWYHQYGQNAGDIGRLRNVFLHGWDAHVDAIDAAYSDPPEVDPEDAEAQRIAETFADAADEYRAIEAGDLP